MGTLRHGDKNIEIVDIAAVMFVAEVEGDEAVELIKVNVREELAGEIADDDALTGWLIKEAFAFGEMLPVGAATANGDVLHRAIENDFFPEIFQGFV